MPPCRGCRNENFACEIQYRYKSQTRHKITGTCKFMTHTQFLPAVRSSQLSVNLTGPKPRWLLRATHFNDCRGNVDTASTSWLASRRPRERMPSSVCLVSPASPPPSLLAALVRARSSKCAGPGPRQGAPGGSSVRRHRTVGPCRRRLDAATRCGSRFG